MITEMDVSRCLHIFFLTHTIDKMCFVLKDCTVIEIGCICNVEQKNAIIPVIKWLYKLLWAGLGISSLFIISLEKFILSSKKKKIWCKSVLKFDLFIHLENLLCNLWYLCLVVETGIYWVLKIHLWSIGYCIKTTWGNWEYPFTPSVYTVEGYYHDLSKREHFLSCWDPMWILYTDKWTLHILFCESKSTWRDFQEKEQRISWTK